MKRGAWLARKIIAEPPADPPPNVPGIEESIPSFPCANARPAPRPQGCISCHAGIDPWGLPLEQFDAAVSSALSIEARLTADGTEVADYAALRAYLVGPRMDRVAFSVLGVSPPTVPAHSPTTSLFFSKKRDLLCVETDIECRT